MSIYKKFMKPNFEPRSSKDPFQFSIEGDPMPFFKSRHTQRTTWNAMQSAITSYRNNLQNACDSTKQLEGPLFLNIEFYLPYHYKNETFLINRPHGVIPQLTRLVQFVEQVALEVEVINNPGQICSLFAKKLWTDKPRTEFLLYEVVA